MEKADNWKEFRDKYVESSLEESLSIIEPKITALIRKYGKGSIILHFKNDLNKQLMIKEILNRISVRKMIQIDSSFILNDKMIWFPLKYINKFSTLNRDIEQYETPQYHPRSCYISIITVVVKAKQIHKDVFFFTLIPNFNINPNSLFKCKYTKFLQSSMKFTKFKELFPVFYDQLLIVNKVRKYGIDLITFSWELIGCFKVYCSRDEFQLRISLKCPLDGKFVKYSAPKIEYIKIKNISVHILFKAVLYNQFYGEQDAKRVYEANCNVCEALASLSNDIDCDIMQIENLKTFHIRLFYQLNALKRIMIKIYGSKCDHCCKIPKWIGKTTLKYKKCSNCKTMYYCSKQCQKIHWKQHHNNYCWVYKRIYSCFA